MTFDEIVAGIQDGSLTQPIAMIAILALGGYTPPQAALVWRQNAPA